MSGSLKHDIFCPIMGGDPSALNYWRYTCLTRQSARPQDCPVKCPHRATTNAAPKTVATSLPVANKAPEERVAAPVSSAPAPPPFQGIRIEFVREEDIEVLVRFTEVSRESGGDLAEDVATVLELYLAGLATKGKRR